MRPRTDTAHRYTCHETSALPVFLSLPHVWPVGGTAMTPLELATQCAQALASSEPAVTLAFPKGGRPKGFPCGELLNEMTRGGVVEQTMRFDPTEVLAWLVANGLAVVRREGNQLALSAPGSKT